MASQNLFGSISPSLGNMYGSAFQKSLPAKTTLVLIQPSLVPLLLNHPPSFISFCIISSFLILVASF
jgi:hypothetical protein